MYFFLIVMLLLLWLIKKIRRNNMNPRPSTTRLERVGGMAMNAEVKVTHEVAFRWVWAKEIPPLAPGGHYMTAQPMTATNGLQYNLHFLRGCINVV